MELTHLAGVGVALSSALAWGSGDFSGGLASRRADQGRVLVLAALSGLGLLAVTAMARGEPLPSPTGAWVALAAGGCGGIGLGALYRGLARGRVASVAPLAAVTGAAVPVLVGAVRSDLPAPTEVAGLALALTGIWFVSRAASREGSNSGASHVLALVAGLGFGGFFVFVARIDHEAVFGSLALARVGTLAVALLLLGRWLWMGGRQVAPLGVFAAVAVMAGVLDAGGNVLYLYATRLTRMDVAAVLGSLYPAVTVLLASRILQEEVTPPQWAGLALCLGAVGLIAL